MTGVQTCALPIFYSSGVLLALKSGDLAAEAIGEGLRKGDVSAAQLGTWAGMFNEGVDRMRRLVCEYYDGFSFGRFVRAHPDLRGTITDLLIGDLFTDKVDKVWNPMEAMYPPGKRPPITWDAGTPMEKAKEKGDPKEHFFQAIDDFTVAAQLEPTYAYVFKDLGVVKVALAKHLLAAGERPRDILEQAVEHLTRAIKL